MFYATSTFSGSACRFRYIFSTTYYIVLIFESQFFLYVFLFVFFFALQIYYESCFFVVIVVGICICCFFVLSLSTFSTLHKQYNLMGSAPASPPDKLIVFTCSLIAFFHAFNLNVCLFIISHFMFILSLILPYPKIIHKLFL